MARVERTRGRQEPAAAGVQTSPALVSKPLANGKIDPNTLFAIDQGLADDGYWAVIDGYQFKIARLNNPAHEAYIARMGEAKRRAYQGSEMPLADFQVVQGELVAHSFLRDWDERFVDFTLERAVEFCTRNPHITSQIVTIASDYHNFLLRDREADQKN